MAGILAQSLRQTCRVNGLQLIAASKVTRNGIPKVGLPVLGSSAPIFATLPVSRSSSDVAKHHNHTPHWTAERGLSVALIGIIPAALAFPHPILDCALAFSLTMHATWGMESIVEDYVRPSIFGAVIPKVAMGGLYALSIFAFVGLCSFSYYDIGLVNTVRMIWTL